MAIRGNDADFGPCNADTFTDFQNEAPGSWCLL